MDAAVSVSFPNRVSKACNSASNQKKKKKENFFFFFFFFCRWIRLAHSADEYNLHGAKRLFTIPNVLSASRPSVN